MLYASKTPGQFRSITLVADPASSPVLTVLKTFDLIFPVAPVFCYSIALREPGFRLGKLPLGLRQLAQQTSRSMQRPPCKKRTSERPGCSVVDRSKGFLQGHKALSVGE